MIDNIEVVKSSLEKLIDVVIQKLPSIAIGIMMLVVGSYVIRLIMRLIARRFESRNVDVSIRSFLESIIRIVLYVLLLLTSASTMGIQTTSFIAILSAFGLAVGLALQGSLSNFAGGVLILLFRPFEVGDEIESANGSSGTVEKIDLLYTSMVGDDGIKVFSPNGSLANSVIRNMSSVGKRRVQFTVHLSYNTDVQALRQEILALLRKDKRVMPRPSATFHVGDLTDTGMQVFIRAWVSHKGFLKTKGDLAEQVKVVFEKQHVTFGKTSIKVITVD